MRWTKPAVLLLFLLAVSGCATPDRADYRERSPIRIEIPRTRQATNYTCGVAVVQSILAHNGYLHRQDVLETRLGADPERGTPPESMIQCLREHAIGAELREGMTVADLQACIDAGKPVICFLQAWNGDPTFDYTDGWDDGHYAVAIGYDAGRIYFMDPSTLGTYTYIPTGQFLTRWHDGDGEFQFHNGGIVVTNPRPVYRPDVFTPML